MTVLIVDDQPDVVRGEQQGIDWEKLGIGRILTAYSVPEARSCCWGSGWISCSVILRCRPTAGWNC